MQASTDAAAITVESREQLIYLLAEAAELEHGLMCSYLFAAFSLKREGPDLQEAERRAIAGWRASIHAVAMEEMLHLCLVQNLLASIGAAPHVRRPNFPVPPGLYPSGMHLDLARFTPETIAHFVFLERPEDATIADTSGDAPSYARAPGRAGLTPSAQDYETVGELYSGIAHGFAHLADALGVERLFVGDRAAQVDRALVDLDGLDAVIDVASAHRAIERIVEQGEGGRRHHDASHFVRFQRIQDELAELRRARPDFEPAHPVVTNPVMNAPADASRCVHVSDPRAARVLDLANTTYGLMVQLLAGFFCATGRGPDRKRLIDAAIVLMRAGLAPLCELLATLPASAGAPNATAGMSFTLPRSVHALPREPAASALLHERALELCAACTAAGGAIAAIGDRLRPVAAALSR